MWTVLFDDDFDREFATYSETVKERIAAKALLLKQFGPQLSRPHVDTLKQSKFPNMKELRVPVDEQIWRVAFAFDPERQAILLVAGDKQGKSESKFYKDLIKIADKRFERHLRDDK